MIVTLAGLASDAWARWRRDRAVLVAFAGLFVFLPFFAWLLLLTPPDIAAEVGRDERMNILIAWMGANLHWLAARVAIELFGSAAILMLYLGRGHRDVAGVLRAALALFPLFVVAILVSWGLVSIGLFAFVLPGFYIYGRIALTGAVFAAEPGVGVIGAITRSIALTRGRGWLVFGYLALTLLTGLLMAEVFGGVEAGMKAAGGANPIAVAILDALSAAAMAVATLARLLFEVSLYRRLAAPRPRV